MTGRQRLFFSLTPRTMPLKSWQADSRSLFVWDS